MVLFVVIGTVVFLILIYLLLKLLWPQIVIFYYAKKIHGPPNDTYGLGNIFRYFDTPENILKVTREWSLKYYPNFLNWFGSITIVLSINPYDYEKILTNTKHIAKSPIYDILHKWLGTGLLTSTGSKWHHRRKILTPAFHFNILKKFLPVIQAETEKLVEVLKKESHKQCEIEITQFITQFALNTIGETAMGVSFDSKDGAKNSYKQSILEICDIVMYRIFRPWLWNPLLYAFHPYYYKENRMLKILHGFTNRIIAERKEKFQGIDLSESDQDEYTNYSKRKRLAMLDLLLSEQKENDGIDDDGIREEVDTFMFEGHDTVSSALYFTLMLIACYPDIQEKIIEEMREVLGDIRKKPSYSELQDLKYLDMCIKESLRIYPSVHFVGRILGEDMTTSCGHFLKKGTTVHLPLFNLHHNPDFYPEPERFDPERFLPENCKDRHPFAYIPFSAGPRNCIGQRFANLELKLVLTGILGNFILKPVDTPETVVLVIDLVLRSKYGIKIKFFER